MKLSNFDKGRDNNFNFIRIVAAFAVLISHSFALAIGSGDSEPLRKSLGITPGTIAVDIFFIISGFLVTGSLLTRKSVSEFIWARALRIFPALLVMVVWTVFCLGLFITKIPLWSYLIDPATHIYLFKNASIFTGVTYNLPGVFENNPYKNVVNGSLWSMPIELTMYVLLLFFWVVLRTTPEFRSRFFKFTIICCAIVSGFLNIMGHFCFSSEKYYYELSFMFFTGAAFYILKEHITLSYSFFFLCIIALALSTAEQHTFFLVYSLSIAYVILFLACVPSGKIRSYNHAGDYSYGVYLYAFPIQQSVAALIPGIPTWSLTITSGAFTLLLAILSWHCLEKHALSLKNSYVSRTKLLFNNIRKSISTSSNRS